MRESWTDERLDDMKLQMEAGFTRVDQDIRSLRTEMNQRFEGLQRAMIYGVVALSGSFIAGFGALATQL